MKGKVIFFLAASIACLTMSNQAFAEKSFREALAGSENVLRLLPIDAYHSFVAPHFFNKLYPELATLALKRGGRPEVKVQKVDPFTGKFDIAWLPVEVSEEGKYVHPVTGKMERFSYGDAETPLSESPTELLFRGVVSLEGRWIVDGGTPGIKTRKLSALILKHETPQPFIYKSPELPSPDRLVAPTGTSDESDVTDWTFTEKGHAESGFFGKLLNIDPTGIVSQEHFVAYQAVCQGQGGSGRFAVDESERATANSKPPREVGAREAFERTKDATVFFGCEGPLPFLVKFGETIVYGPGRSLADLEPGDGQAHGAISETVRTGEPPDAAVGTLPDGLEDFIALTARNATKYGRFESSAFGYTLKGEALAGQMACLVEVQVLQGARLIDRRQVDVCR